MTQDNFVISQYELEILEMEQINMYLITWRQVITARVWFSVCLWSR